MSVVALTAAACGSASAPPSAPTFTLVGPFSVSFADSTVNPGDSVLFTIAVPGGLPANADLVLTLGFDGRRSAPDTVHIPPEPGLSTTGQVTLQGYLTVPLGNPDGTLTLIATLPQVQDSASASLTIRNTLPPGLIAGMTWGSFPVFIPMSNGLPALFGGLTDTLSIQASAAGGLAWVGYAMGPPANVRDSVSAQGAASGVLNVPVAIPSAWAGSTIAVTVFAYDQDGHFTQDSLGLTSVGLHLTRPVRTVAVDTATRRAVYDTKRNVVYFAVGDQAAIQVLSLSSMTYGTPIPLPTPAADLDIRPGGDSLVVALANRADLAFANVLTSPATVSVVHLTAFDAPGGDTTNAIDTVLSVRQASDGRVLMAFLEGPANTATFGVAEFNPSTAADSVLISTLTYGPSALVRSGNGAAVLMTNVGPSDPYLLYNARTQAFTGPFGNNDHLLETASADSDGSAYAFGLQLYSGALALLGTSAADGQIVASTPTQLSASGTQFYVSGTQFYKPGIPPYYMRFVQEPVRFNGAASGGLGLPLEVVDIPQSITQFVALPDTTRLFALGQNTAMLFDLTQSSPSSSPSAVAKIRHRPSSLPLIPAPSRLSVRIRMGRHQHTFRPSR